MSLARRVFDTTATLSDGLGLTAAIKRIASNARGPQAVILAYHDINEVESEGVIHPERLRRHIRLLKAEYDLCTVSEAVDALSRPGGLKRDLAVLTFDDGYKGNFRTALPILQQEEVSATIYLTTGFLDGTPLWFDVARRAKGREPEAELIQSLPGWRPEQGIEAALEQIKELTATERASLIGALEPFTVGTTEASPLTWDEARALQNAGIELGAHTVTHPILSSLPLHEQQHELKMSRQRMTEETGTPPRSFAIPNGTVADFAEDTLRLAREVGFDSVCTMVRGTNAPGVDPMRLKRIGVGADSDAALRMRLSGVLEFLRSNAEMKVPAMSRGAQPTRSQAARPPANSSSA